MNERETDTRALAVAEMVSVPNAIKQTPTEVDNVFKTEKFSAAPITNINSGKESIIDSQNFKTKITKVMKSIQNTKTSDNGKIKLAEFICNKLYNIYHIPNENKQIIINELTSIIYNSQDMPLALRLYYLKFRNVSVPYPVSINLFYKGIRNKLDIIPYFQILKYILHADISLREDIHISEVLNEFENIFEDEDVSIYTKMEIADIFILNDRLERGHEMLDILREMEVQIILDTQEHPNPSSNERITTIYTDTQNVHTTDINDSVLKACVNLMEIQRPIGFDTEQIRNVLYKVSPESKSAIDTVLERIEIDTSRFKYEDNMFGLYDVFSSLWLFISNHEFKQELLGRLIEEITSMSKYCTTGHVSRFINVIQGYTQIEDLQVRISDKQQIRAYITHTLDIILKDSPENIMDSLVSEDKSQFYNFIQDMFTEKHITELLQKYGQVQSHILDAVKAYTKWDYWDINDNKLIYLNYNPK
jgi:hypothetical protein